MLFCFLIKLIYFSSTYIGQKLLMYVIVNIILGHKIFSISPFRIIACTISMIILPFYNIIKSHDHSRDRSYLIRTILYHNSSLS